MNLLIFTYHLKSLIILIIGIILGHAANSFRDGQRSGSGSLPGGVSLILAVSAREVQHSSLRVVVALQKNPRHRGIIKWPLGGRSFCNAESPRACYEPSPRSQEDSMDGWMLRWKSGTTRAVWVRGTGSWIGGPQHTTRGEHSMCPPATCCHVPTHQVASHKLISCAELFLRIQNREMLTVVLEVYVWEDLIGLMQSDQPHSSGGFIIPIKSFLDLVKWQQLDAVRLLGNGHVVTNLAHQLWICGVVKYALA